MTDVVVFHHAQSLPDALVDTGFSLAVRCAQSPAQTRPTELGAVLVHGCGPERLLSLRAAR